MKGKKRGDRESPESPIMPEIHLLFAILEQAMLDAIRGAEGSSQKKQAVAWIFSDSKKFGSCVWVCENADLDVGEYRKAVEKAMREVSIRRKKRRMST